MRGMYRGRLLFVLPLLAAWGAALGAIYVHPTFWILFAALVLGIIVWQIRNWRD